MPDAFFERYRRALAAGDAASVVAAYRYPLPVIRPDRLRVIQDADTMRAEIDKLLDFYRWSGMTEVAMSGFRCDGFDVGLDIVSLTWRPLTAGGAEIAAIDVTYALRRVTDGARIAAVMAHNEERRRAPIIRDAIGALGVSPPAVRDHQENPT